MKEKIKAIQNGNKKILEEMVLDFEPLIRKYAYMLRNEDEYQEMALMFISLIKNMAIDSMKNSSDGAIVNYIKHSMYHAYIERSKKLETIENHEYTTDVFPEYGREEEYDGFEDLLEAAKLNGREKSVLRKIYCEGYSAAEIAKTEGISRQSVNQMKNRALKKLKEVLSE